MLMQPPYGTRKTRPASASSFSTPLARRYRKLKKTPTTFQSFIATSGGRY
jgi:hypothetical protein